MAEGIASGLVESLLTKVVSTASQEIGLLYGLKDELKKLEDTLTTINDVLADAEKQEKQEKSHAIRNWIKRLEQVVYHADDLLDEFAYEELRMRVDHRLERQVSDLFSSSNNQLAFRLKMVHDIKEIIGRLDEIANDISKFNFLSKTVMPVNTRFFGNKERDTDSFVLPSALIIGRDREKEEIIKKLIGPDSNTSVDGVPVIAIVGIGGLGKTSLAKLVFNDKRVAEHFEEKIWVCVSEDFDRKLIVKNILKCITKESVEKLDLEPLQVRLRRNLDGRKYLLVLDDVWNEDKEKWIQLKEMLMAGANGSQIAVTTRSVKVASAMGIDSPYILKGLSNELSRELFEQLAFGKQLQKVHPKVREIGKDLIKRCKGAPLAIRTLGSTMGSKTSESEWLSIQNSEIWSSSPNDGGILSVLKLSYDQLPTHIKNCFAYCSIFPKDYNFEYEVLIQLWMAQGYVQTSSDKLQILEYIGGQYIKELLSISFLQEVEVDVSGNITNFKMHDLIHDLAIGVAGSNCYCLTKSSMKNGNYDESIRHISLEVYFIEELPRRLLKAKGMRTLFCLDSRYDWEMGLSCQHIIMSNLTCLRVLHLNSCDIKELVSSIDTLKHLRYLDLSYNDDLEGLPNSISNLLNLQTLNLNGCGSIKELPRDISKLNNLRHLMMEECFSVTHMPSGLGNFTVMQELTFFIVGNDETVGHSCYGKLQELKGLNDLRGQIRIINLEKMGADDAAALEESKEAILKEKQHLESLSLYWEDTESAADKITAELVLESLEPHPNLKEFDINRYYGVRFPSWMIKMGNVVDITLVDCERCELLQPLDQLPCLKFLHLRNFNSLEYIQEEKDYDHNKKQVRDGHPPPPSSSSSSSSSSTLLLLLFFPSLQQLQLSNLPKLKGWWKRRRESVSTSSSSSSSSSSSLVFPQLAKLSIQRCPMFTSMPLHPNIKELELTSVSEKLVRERLTTTTTNSTSAEQEEERKVDDYHHHQILEGEGEGESFRYLTSLRTLEISSCAKLKSISREVQHLTALENLILRNCPELELSDGYCMHWQGLRSLRKLDFEKIPKLVTLPVGIQHLTTLQHLQIRKCDGFLVVPDWIGNLTQLQQLRFSICPRLVSLPQEIRCLTSLQQLEIVNCPKLSKRYQKGTGEDWLKIAHIPNLRINPHVEEHLFLIFEETVADATGFSYITLPLINK